MKQLVIAVMLAAGLTACSGSGPSKGDIESALEHYVRDNGWNDAKVQNVKSGECKESTASSGYACTVNFRALANNGRFNEEMSGSFVFDEIDGDWRVAGATRL